MLSTTTALIGLLAREGKPLRLAEIRRSLDHLNVSKATLYRHLASLVEQGVVSKQREHYSLIVKGNATIQASDLSRISEMKPLDAHYRKGLRITIYGPEKLHNINLESIKKSMEGIVGKILEEHNPDLEGLLEDGTVSPQTIQDLAEIKLGLVVTFEGIDFISLTPEEVKVKRREAMRLIARENEIALEELAKSLELTILEAHQVLDPLFIAGLIAMDETGRISYTLEVKDDA